MSMRQRLWGILILLAVTLGIIALVSSRQKVEPLQIEDQTQRLDPTQEDSVEDGPQD